MCDEWSWQNKKRKELNENEKWKMKNGITFKVLRF